MKKQDFIINILCSGIQVFASAHMLCRYIQDDKGILITAIPVIWLLASLYILIWTIVKYRKER